MSKTDLQQRQDGLIRLFEGAPIIRTFGMKLQYNEEHQAIVDLPFNPGLDHALLQTHGGALATLLDTAGWFTVAPHFDTWVATVEFSTRLLEPTEKQDLRATGRILRLGRRLVVAEMQVKDLQGRRIATGAGTFAVSDRPLSV